MVLLGGVLALAAVGAPALDRTVKGPNMNGEYLLADTPGQAGKGNWSTSFKDYPGGVESFDFYLGPVTSTYGEVFWTGLPPAKFPDDIVQRFKGKGMAVVVSCCSCRYLASSSSSPFAPPAGWQADSLTRVVRCGRGSRSIR